MTGVAHPAAIALAHGIAFQSIARGNVTLEYVVESLGIMATGATATSLGVIRHAAKQGTSRSEPFVKRGGQSNCLPESDRKRGKQGHCQQHGKAVLVFVHGRL
jgi:hypothetical protein